MFSIAKSSSLLASSRAVVNRSFAATGGVTSRDKSTLVLVRHGESTWNLANRFTGWYDCPLSENGTKEAIAGGEEIRKEGITPDVAFTSLQRRAITTLFYTLDATDRLWIPITKSWKINERHYGALQGLDKQETVDKYGKEQVLEWRRSYDIPPPTVNKSSEHHPVNDPRYADKQEWPEEFTESLATTLDRVVPFYQAEIAPELKKGKTVVIAAHGNSLRALVKYLDNIAPEEICELNIPTAVPLYYELDDDLKPIAQPGAFTPLTGRYLGDQDAIRARIEGVKNQTK